MVMTFYEVESQKIQCSIVSVLPLLSLSFGHTHLHTHSGIVSDTLAQILCIHSSPVFGDAYPGQGHSSIRAGRHTHTLYLTVNFFFYTRSLSKRELRVLICFDPESCLYSA